MDEKIKHLFTISRSRAAVLTGRYPFSIGVVSITSKVVTNQQTIQFYSGGINKCYI